MRLTIQRPTNEVPCGRDQTFEQFCAEQDRIAPTMDLQVSRETLRQSLAHIAPVSPRKAD